MPTPRNQHVNILFSQSTKPELEHLSPKIRPVWSFESHAKAKHDSHAHAKAKRKSHAKDTK